jgi:Domain of unknown function (DUF4384)
MLELSTILHRSLKTLTGSSILSLLISFSLWSQTPQRIVEDGYATLGPDVTMHEAERKALDDAFAKAIVRIAGIRLQSESFLSKSEDMEPGARESRFVESFSVINRSVSYGRIVSHAILLNEIEETPFPDGSRLRRVHLKVQADVVKETGEIDQSFQVTLELNKDDLAVDGESGQSDELIITVTCTKDGYLTLFGVSDDTVRVLFPNVLMNDSRIRQNEPFLFPSDDLRREGIHLRGTLPSGRTKTTEAVLAVVTKDSIAFQGGAKSGAQGTIPTYQVALEELNKWLCFIPPNKRVEVDRIFAVRKR